MNSLGSALSGANCASSFVFNTITLQNSAILTHSATTSTQAYGLTFSANSINIDSTSKIDVSGKGYPQVTANKFRVQGNIDASNQASNTNTISGGSYGGEGGTYDVTHFPAYAYGSIMQPTDLGSSAASGVGSSGAGGGQLKITITSGGALTNNGKITAAGGGSVLACNNASGSGGSVWITASTITGTGTIDANGGGTTGNCIGGGGGRVALYYTTLSGNFSYPTSTVASVTASGGIGNAAYRGAAAGTVFLQSQSKTYGDLVINNNSNSNNTRAATSIPTWVASNPINMTNTTIQMASALMADTYLSTKTPYLGWSIDPNIAVNATATEGDNYIYSIVSWDGTNYTVPTGSTMLAHATPSVPAQNMTLPILALDHLQISGLPIINTSAKILVYNGDLLSGPGNATLAMANLPAGLDFQNTGTISINGQSLGNSINIPLTLSGASLSLQNGTFTFSSALTVSRLSATNTNITAQDITATTNGVVLTGTTATVSSITASGAAGALQLSSSTVTLGKTKGTLSINLGGNLILASSSKLIQAATTLTTEKSLEISAAGLSIDSTSSIVADGAGFLSSGTTDYFRSFGNSDVKNVNAATGGVAAAGGSHGGRGGYTGTNAPSEVYGSLINPWESGSSGGKNVGITPANGGGIIRINLGTGSAALNGVISANGAAATSAGGGAGGSIYINTGTISGTTGTISANGGNGSSGYGGGGGRVALYYTSLPTTGNFVYNTTLPSSVTAYGGTGTAAAPATVGAAGTVYLKNTSAQTYGDLIINNNSVDTAFGGLNYTKIVMPSVSTSSSLTDTTLNKASYFNESIGGASSVFTGNLQGFYVQPNTAENSTQTITDDTLFKIISHDSNVLTTSSGMLTSGAAAGNSFKVSLVLDNFEIRGRSNVYTTGTIWAKSGDVTSNDATSAVMAGTLIGTGGVEYGTTVSPLGVFTGDATTKNSSNTTVYGTITFNRFNSNGSVTFNNGTYTTLDGLLAVGSLTASNLTYDPTSITSNSSITASTGSVSLSASTVKLGNITTLSVSGNLAVNNATSLTIKKLKSTAIPPVSNTGMNIGGQIQVLNSSTIYQEPTTLLAEYSLEMSAGSLTVDTTSKISADGRGYVPNTSGSLNYFRSFGNVDIQNILTNTSAQAGGSHGGRGGGVSSAHVSNEVYGSIVNPWESGSSGSYYSGTTPTNGGGIIRINLGTGTATVNGTISANAANSNGGAHPPGAGGSLYLRAGTLTGTTGVLSANGNANVSAPQIGGGGGRVAVYYTSFAGNFATPVNALASITAYGGAGSTQSGAAGTVYLFQTGVQTRGDLIINNGGSGVGTPSSSNLNYTRIVMPSNATPTAFSDTTLTRAGYFNESNYGYTGYLQGYSVQPNIAENTTPTLSDDHFFPILSHTANVLTTGSGMTGYASTGNTFRVGLILDGLELRNNAYVNFDGPVLSQGGDYASGDTVTAVVSGLFATGSSSFEFSPANTVSINAQNGSFVLGNSPTNGALLLSSGSFSAPGNMSVGSLSLTNVTSFTATGITGTGNISLTNSTMTLSTPKSTSFPPAPSWAITTGGSISLASSSTINQQTSTGTTEYSLEINASGLSIDGSSQINASGKGYQTGLAPNYNFRTFGNVNVPNVANSGAGDANTQVGGSHGGRGGGNGGHSANEVYGSFYNPWESGSSSPTTPGWTGGPGGGIIRINLNGGPATFVGNGPSGNGSIVANGIGSGYNMGGAGGSVYLNAGSISATGTLTGSNGIIQANGGSANGGGGGGRIAIFYTALSSTGNLIYPSTAFFSKVTAFGGTGGIGGGAGTVYLKNTISQTYGDLIVNNNSQGISIGSPNYTKINFPSNANSTGLTSNSLTAATNAFSELISSGVYANTTYLQGYSIRPNSNENSTPTMMDDNYFKINSNTSNVLSTASDLTTVASTTNPYQVGLILDNFEVRGNANIYATGPIWALSGDVASGDTVTANISGNIAGGGGVEFGATPNSMSSVSINALGGSVTFNSYPQTGALTLVGGTYTYSTPIVAGSLVLNGANVTMAIPKSTSTIPTPNYAINLSGSLQLINGGQLWQATTTQTTEYSLEIQAASLTIDSNSSSYISATGRGYAPPSGNNTVAGNSKFRGFGNVNVGNTNGDTNVAAGGSHGGRGGVSGGHYPNEVYGSFVNPWESGSSGGGWPGWGVCSGGGIIRINLGTGTATLLGNGGGNGAISANGSGGCNSGGAGGSVYLNAGAINSVSSSGVITANGGTSGNASGGGGRIAVYYTSLTGAMTIPNLYNSINAFGGSSAIGAAGTIYLKNPAQTFGDLLINNNGNTNNGNPTFTKMMIPTGTVANGLTGTTLSVSSSTYFNESIGAASPVYTGHLAGLSVQPNVAENSTSTLTDDHYFPIASHTGNVFTTISPYSGQDMRNYGATSSPFNTFNLALVLDSLEVRGNATFSPTGPVLVMSGDISSNDTSTVSWTGNLRAPGSYTSNSTFDATSLSSFEFGTLPGFTANPVGDITLSGGNYLFTRPIVANSLNLTGSTVLTMAIPKSQAIPSVPNYAISLTGALQLSSNAQLWQAATTLTTEYSLEIQAGSLSIDNSSAYISAMGRGYVPTTGNGTSPGNSKFRTFGNVDVGNINGDTNVAAGGSHGGRGGVSGGHYPDEVYGSFVNPWESGSSGGGWPGWSVCSGGGIIRINLGGGTATFLGNGGGSGAIVADGAGGCNSGGAGGSVYLSAGAINSTMSSAVITANGGSSSASGGGGRIALYYSSMTGAMNITNLYNSINAFGGASSAAAAGTIYLKNPTQVYGDLLINNNGTTNNGNPTFTRFVIPSGTSSNSLSATALGVSSPTYFYENIGTASPVYTGHLQGLSVQPNANENSTLTLTDDHYFPITSSTGNALTTSTSPNPDMTAYGSVGNTFKTALLLDSLEIRGGAMFSPTGPVLVMSGDITSNDTSTVSWNGTFSGPATLMGLSVLGTTSLGTVEFANLGAVTFTSGTVQTYHPMNLSSLTLNAASLWTGMVKSTAVPPVSSWAIQSSGTINLTNSSRIYQNYTTGTNEYSLEIKAANLSIDSTSNINADGRGYLGGALGASGVAPLGKFKSFGNVDVANANGDYSGAASQAGGSHGGRGGYNSSGAHVANETYGSIANPWESGSSGGSVSGWTSSSGGGIIRIDLGTGTLTLTNSNQISANGQTAGNAEGAGGSVYIKAGTLSLPSITNLITANGGSSTEGGGGGRIAIYYTSLTGGVVYTTIYNQITAFGGTGGTGGGAGTIFLKSAAQNYGDLLLNNNNAAMTIGGNGNYTRINIPSASTSTALTATSLSATGTSFNEGSYGYTGHLQGLSVQPYTGENSTTTLTDDHFFPIQSHTSSVLTTNTTPYPNMTAYTSDAGAAGAYPYRVGLILDNLEVRGKANVLATGPVLAYSGDISSGDTISVVMGGYFSGPLEFGTSPTSITNYTLNGGGALGSQPVNAANLTLQSGTFSSAAALNPTGSLTLSSATLTASNISPGGSLIITSSTVNSSNITAGGAVTLTSSTVNGGSLSNSGNISLTGSTMTLGMPRSTAVPTAPNWSINTTGNISLSSSSRITQTQTTASTEYTLEINAANLTIDGSSTVDAYGKGYAWTTPYRFKTFGNVDVTNINGDLAAGTASGGSHGGRGAYNGGHYPIESYGSFYNPWESGSSAGYNAGWSSCNGGGIVRINLSGTATLSGIGTGFGSVGAINASSPSICNLMGAGGSVYLKVSALSVPATAGVITANGGSGNQAGGGGGRVAVFYGSLTGAMTAANAYTSINAYGGAGGTGGAAGTVFLKSNSDAYGSLILNNNTVNNFGGMSFTKLNIPSGTASFSLSPTSLSVSGSAYFNEGSFGYTGHLQGLSVQPNASENSTLTLTDDHYFPILSQTSSALNTGTSTNVSSASDMTAYGSSGQNFNLALILDNFEARGYAYYLATGPILALSGDLSSNNTTTAVVAANSVPAGLAGVNTGPSYGLEFGTGVTTVSISPPNNNASYPFYFNGALGANVTLQNSAFTSNLSLNVGGSLTLSSATYNGTSLTSSGNISLTSSTMTLGMPKSTAIPTAPSWAINTTGNISLTSSSRITQTQTTASTEYTLEINAANLTIDASSTIDAYGKGYVWATPYRFKTFGNVDVTNINGDLTANTIAGGSHGGRGAYYSGGNYPNESYGSFYNPWESGSSAGYYSGGWSSCNGGGVVRINLSGTATLSGVGTGFGSVGAINASATNACNLQGAGGSVYLKAATISSPATAGMITANGGSGNQAGGGGGRIAIFYGTMTGGITAANVYNSINAYGGGGGSGGAAGTVFLKANSETYGSLILNSNTNTFGTPIFTAINIPSGTASFSLSPSSLSVSGSNYFNEGSFGYTGHLQGLSVQPNALENTTPQLADDHYFPILSHTSNMLNVGTSTNVNSASDMTSYASAGQNFNLALILDNLEIRSYAYYLATGPILALSGDLSSNNTTTAVVAGNSVPAGLAGINTGSSYGIEFGTNVNSVTISPTSNSGSYPFYFNGAPGAAVILQNSTFASSGPMTVGSLTVTGSNYFSNNTQIIASGAVNFTNSTVTTTGNSITAGGNIVLNNTIMTLGMPKSTTVPLSPSWAMNTPTGAIQLISNSILYQAPTTQTTEYTLELNGASLSIDNLSMISAIGRGYTSSGAAGKFRSFGNLDVQNLNGDLNSQAGGSHGGRGGVNGVGQNPPQTYGSIMNPWESGSSAGYVGGWSICPGGGIIRINLSGALSMTGTGPSTTPTGFSGGGWYANPGAISANGGGGCNVNGAGGSIYINAGSLTQSAGAASAVISANGGNYNQAGGGGGRIAVYYGSLAGSFSYPTLYNNITAFGSTTGTTCGGAGTIYLKSAAQTYGDLIVNNNGTSCNTTPIVMAASGAFPTATTDTTLTNSGYFNEPNTVSGNIGYTGHLQGFAVQPNMGENATTTLSDDHFFRITSHTSDVLTTVAGMNTYASTSNPFRIGLLLDNLEIRGKSNLTTSGPIFVTSGDVSSNDNTTAVVSGTLAGTGSLEFGSTVNSLTIDAGGTANIFALAGVSSGAVSLKNGTYNFSSFTAGSLALTSTILNGTSLGTSAGNFTMTSSTVNVSSLSTVGGSLSMSGSAVTTSTANIGGNLTIDSSSTLTAGNSTKTTPNVVVSGTLTVSNSSTLYSKATTLSQENYLYLSSGNVTVDTSSKINADGAGYPDPLSPGYFRTVGNINTRNINQDGSSSAGGSYGGRGGATSTHSTNEVYGNFKQPNYLGTSGGNFNAVGAGGGFIRATVSGTLSNSGTISANGVGSGDGGSGGSLWISTGTLTGTGGKFTANGGSGGNVSGGGGRIALYYNTITSGSSFDTGSKLVTQFNAYGGNTGNNATLSGAAGTIYFFKNSVQTYGDLLVNNTITANAATVFLRPATTAFDSLSSSGLTQAGAFTFSLSPTASVYDQLLGYYLNPRIDQNATGKLSDDTVFPITLVTASSLTTSGDPTTVSGSSSTYKLALVLDNLDVRGNAVLDFGNQNIRVLSGDLNSNDSVTFNQVGTINAGTVDVGTTVNWTGTASGTIGLKCSSNYTSGC